MRPIIGITQDVELKGHEPGGFWAYLDRNYAEAVYRFGGMPLMIPVIGGPDAARDIVSRMDGLLLSGGDDIHPRYYGEEPLPGTSLSPDVRTDYDFALLREALDLGRPVLGICLGVQTMNVYFGGTLSQDVAGHKGAGADLFHEVALSAGSRLCAIAGAGRMKVNSFHHQAIKELGKGLAASAVSDDGVVEAVELPGEGFVVGVQWHPERMHGDAGAERLFRAFMKT